MDRKRDGGVDQAGTGMSLRAYFAGQVLVAMATWTPGTPPDDLGYGSDEWHAWCREQRAKYAVAQADALIKALDE